ncbi:30S ribosome-binding factor RbfA [bacterium]|nr:30S ribosome-binding factor RbfA [bacterium]
MGQRGYNRLEAINEMLRHEVGGILLTEATDPRLAQVALTRVVTTGDLQHARVYYRVICAKGGASRQEVGEALSRARGYVQRLLGPRVRLKFTPVLEFFYDDSVEKLEAIEEKLKEISDSDGQE